ncbi:MAG: ADP-glyceromanno-heptose 6-epimerase [Deltaproteobacteria bacterium]|nr:MAG: ADP-glyceromanno-heptose 6-epimerase [Deltaproteobacteria bacterium]PIE74976.1 MAG: ADP-glyceromanno-heptose 6-epimerase [Deltaproteobacteria bacterium]
MLIVTGGAGFIGSNIVKGLNKHGRNDIIVVDDLTKGEQFLNISSCNIYDYMDKDDFRARLLTDSSFCEKIEAVFHEGACSSTTEWNGKFMMDNNFEYSKIIFHKSMNHNFAFIYASSASVYGDNTIFREEPENEKTLNVYAYSKLLFDNYVRRYLKEIKNQVAGLRYFNVYGPGEFHKEKMASVAWHFYNQIKETGVCKLFEGIDGYENGGQKRDFVYVKDAVDVNIWLWQHPEISGIFNVGTGSAQTFNDMAEAVIKYLGKGKIEYINFPKNLKGRYQSFTQADITKLRQAGYDKEFKNAETGIFDYLSHIEGKRAEL